MRAYLFTCVYGDSQGLCYAQALGDSQAMAARPKAAGTGSWQLQAMHTSVTSQAIYL